MNEINIFFKENRKSFPSYFRIKELRKYIEKDAFYKIILNNKMVGFYVLNDSEFRSLFISKNYRNQSKNLLKMVFNEIKNKNDVLTIAINPNSRRMVKLAKRNGFFNTLKELIGKNNLKMFMYKWVKN